MGNYANLSPFDTVRHDLVVSLAAIRFTYLNGNARAKQKRTKTNAGVAEVIDTSDLKIGPYRGTTSSKEKTRLKKHQVQRRRTHHWLIAIIWRNT
jgi:hypothetical protein